MRLRVARKMSFSWRCKPLRRELGYNIKVRRHMRSVRHEYPKIWAQWCYLAERAPGGRAHRGRKPAGPESEMTRAGLTPWNP